MIRSRVSQLSSLYLGNVYELWRLWSTCVCYIMNKIRVFCFRISTLRFMSYTLIVSTFSYCIILTVLYTLYTLCYTTWYLVREALQFTCSLTARKHLIIFCIFYVIILTHYAKNSNNGSCSFQITDAITTTMYIRETMKRHVLQ